LDQDVNNRIKWGPEAKNIHKLVLPNSSISFPGLSGKSSAVPEKTSTIGNREIIWLSLIVLTGAFGLVRSSAQGASCI
jgi:hypothetical protein